MRYVSLSSGGKDKNIRGPGGPILTRCCQMDAKAAKTGAFYAKAELNLLFDLMTNDIHFQTSMLSSHP